MKCCVATFDVRAERGLKVTVVAEVLRLAEGVDGAAFALAKAQIMLLAGGAVGAEGGDQVGVGGDILQAVESAGSVGAGGSSPARSNRKVVLP